MNHIGLKLFRLAVLATSVAWAQDSGDDKFEVASIRPGDPSNNRIGVQFTPGGGIQANDVTVRMLITMAYNVQPHQVSGGPGWLDSDRYNITAKSPASAQPLTPEQTRALVSKRLQNLLAERFNLKIRQESKEGQGFALVVAKGGAKMKESQGGGPGPMMRMGGRGDLSGQNMTIEMLTRMLSTNTGKTVIDKTGLTGRYDFSLKWVPAPGEGAMFRGGGPGPAPSEAGEASGPSLFTAVQEQLGLKLESAKVDTPLIVVLSADKATEN